MNKSVKVLLGVVLVVVVAGGGFLWWFFSDDAPAEVSLESATQDVSGETTDGTDGGSGDATDGGGTAPTDLTGTWTVDTSTGEFDYESATGSFAGFRIEEELSGIGSTTAVGRTGDVSGTVVVDGSTVIEVVVEVDLTTITTNDSRRDDKVQRALDTGTEPTATFVLTAPIELGDGFIDGEAITVTATGDLTINGVTRPVEMAMEAQLVGGTAVVVGSTDITFSDFGVEVPSSPIVLSADDHGTLELQLLLVLS